MPILLIFALIGACLLVEWPAPLFGGGMETAAASTSTLVVLSLCTALVLRTWVVRTLRQTPERKIEVVRTYGRYRRYLVFINMGMIAACILVFGWGWLTQQLFTVDWNGGEELAPFAELAVPFPYFAILFGSWLIYYDAEKILHCTNLLGHIDREYWSRLGYFVNQLRQFALLVMLPVMLFVTQQTATRFFPETSESELYRIGSVATIPVVILFLPLLIKPLLGLRSMPAGPVRSRLEVMAKRLHFHCSDFLLWPTQGAMANAMIVGLLPRVRYVIFTDRIIEELLPEELEAVFGHEAGHAKHGHVWLYALFLALSITTLAATLLLLDQQLKAADVKLPGWAKKWFAAPVLMLMPCYIFLVFGYLSRRCERQADVYGCRAVSCNDPNCLGHDDSTVYPERARGLCPTGIRTFISALQRVDMYHGSTGLEEEHHHTLKDIVYGFFKWIKAWQHSTMSRRMAFLRTLIGSPQEERRFQRRVTMLRWGLILGLAAILFGLGQIVGWQELLQAM
jgi:STE24 endopeptidase